MSDTTITPEERQSWHERLESQFSCHDAKHGAFTLRLLTALEAAEASKSEAEDYAEKLVYAVTDGNLSNSYDVQVVADEVSRIWQSYTDQKVAAARTEAEAELAHARLAAGSDHYDEVTSDLIDAIQKAEAETARLRAERDWLARALTWTTEPPTVAGLYWFSVCQGLAVCILICSDGKAKLAKDHFTDAELLGGQWAGPIAPPGE